MGSRRSRRVMAEPNLRIGRGPRDEGRCHGPPVGPPWACESARERPKQPLTTVVWQVPPGGEAAITKEGALTRIRKPPPTRTAARDPSRQRALPIRPLIAQCDSA